MLACSELSRRRWLRALQLDYLPTLLSLLLITSPSCFAASSIGELIEQSVCHPMDPFTPPIMNALTSQKSSYIRYRVAFMLLLAAALAYLCRNVVGVAESQIRKDLGLTLEQSGYFMGAFFWTYALFQVPAGSFAQRIGTRYALPLFASVWALGMIACGLAQGLWPIIIAQLFIGIAQAGLLPAACSSIAHWTPLKERSFLCGIMVSGMQVGAIGAAALTGFLIDTSTWQRFGMEPLGWRNVFILYAIPSILWAIHFIIRFRNYPEESPLVSEPELESIKTGRVQELSSTVERMKEPTDWARILTNRSMIFLAGQQICRSAGYMFLASWFPTFLQKVHNVSIEVSGYMQGIVLSGTLLGGFVGGYFIDWLFRRTGSLQISRSGAGTLALGMCSLLVVASWAVPTVQLSVACLTIGSFFAAIAGPALFTTVIDISGTRVPQVFGTLNMMGNLAVAACPIVVGKLFEGNDDWTPILLLFAGIYGVGAICWFFVDMDARLDRDATLDRDQSVAPE